MFWFFLYVGLIIMGNVMILPLMIYVQITEEDNTIIQFYFGTYAYISKSKKIRSGAKVFIWVAFALATWPIAILVLLGMLLKILFIKKEK